MSGGNATSSFDALADALNNISVAGDETDEIRRQKERNTFRNIGHHGEVEEGEEEEDHGSHGRDDKGDDGGEKEREEEEEACCYISKGPTRNRDCKDGVEARPYARPERMGHPGRQQERQKQQQQQQDQHVEDNGGVFDDLAVMGQLGHFLAGAAVGPTAPSAGIPGLPDEPAAPDSGSAGGDPSLMRHVDDLFAGAGGGARAAGRASGSRVILHKPGGGFCSLPAQLALVLDERHSRIGVNIPRLVLPAAAVTSEVQGGSRMEVFLQLDLRVTRVIKVWARVEHARESGAVKWTLK